MKIVIISKKEVKEKMPRSLSPWLTLEERSEVLERLIDFNLIKWDNQRKLPLKSGKTTDIYINLRNARNKPKASAFVARVFAGALFRLNPNRLIEVPDAVTPFSSRIAELLDIPYATVRSEVREGRITAGKYIGESISGERVCIYDDVITDGNSKLIPYQECLNRNQTLLPLVVLVDRQQGWQQKFIELGINMDVWPGMTLHDVRRHLIENGYMKRCDTLEEKNPIIVSLDARDWNDNLPLIDELRTSGCIWKVNDLAFNEGFKNIIPNLQVYGRVMIDLKGHDTPNTLSNIAAHLLQYPPWAVTVHGSGGKEMIEAVVKKLAGTQTKVLVVTVLTSIDKKTCEEIYSRQPLDEVRILARIANRAGAHGIVCAAFETKELKKKYPHMIMINPGIRSAGKSIPRDDQVRISTPVGAIENGADYIIMGRQITHAPDPAAEVRRILEEELEVI